MTATLAPARVSWVERTAVFATFLELGIFAGAWAAALPAIKGDLGLSDRAVSVALLGFAVASIIATLAMGALAGRVGTRGAVRAGLLLTAAALPLPALAGGLPALAVATAAMGFSMGILDVSMNGHAAAVEQRAGRPMMSAFHGAFSLGGLVGAALGGATAGLGPAGQLGSGAAAALVVGLPALAMLSPGAPASPTAAPALALPERRLVGLGIVTAFCFVIEGAAGDWSAIYLDTVARSGLALASAGYAGFSVAMAIARFAGDRAVTRFGARAVLVGGSLAAGAGLMLAVAVPVAPVAALGFGLVGAGLGNVAPVAFGAAARLGSTPAGGVAPVATIGYAGLLLGPPIIGALSGAAGLRVALASLIVAAAVVAGVGRQVLAGRRSRT